ncbi:hypothetical protein GRF29_44g2747582 [Pseudopithomyces chartarum]|uniref:Uncharacterized protein n=1 Tax=Pseudopithomyces chartarum TaxID=1892770 RepID=A0AAN6M3G8_9PLEO|nr:hypothetical protein GRF29_44g2747582 [Pseudopithomyces chartarum]
MQFITSILVFSSIFTGIIASPDSGAQLTNANVDDAECAGLGGVLRIAASDLPEGVSLSDVRKCVEHPVKTSRDKANWSIPPLLESFTDTAPDTNATSPRAEVVAQAAQACYYEAKYGCSGGYCWKHCGSKNDDGKWCWTAKKAGLGDWYTCNTWSDCGTTTYACGVAGMDILAMIYIAINDHIAMDAIAETTS